MALKQVQPLQVRVDQRVMAMKEYSTFPKAPGLEPHYQMKFSVLPRTLIGWEVLPLCRDAVGLF